MNDEKKNQDEIKKNAANNAKVFTLSEFSRETGIRIELLRRFINKQTRQMKNDAWGMIYPSLKELLGEVDTSRPRRIGPPYRRHQELIEMFSDQKVLLDIFSTLPPPLQHDVLCRWEKKLQAAPAKYVSLTADENKLMGLFLAMDETTRDEELLTLVKMGRDFLRTQR